MLRGSLTVCIWVFMHFICVDFSLCYLCSSSTFDSDWAWDVLVADGGG